MSHLRKLEVAFFRRVQAEREARLAQEAAEIAALRVCPATLHLSEAHQRFCEKCPEGNCAKRAKYGLAADGAPLPYKERPDCRAFARNGSLCRNKVVPGKRRCRLHGGASKGPKTEAGKARVAAGQRRRWERWRAMKRSPPDEPPSAG